MQNTRNITSDLIYVGANDRRLHLFENIYPISRGVSYNSYLLLDQQTVLMDCADAAVATQFFDNVAAGLQGRHLDYLVVNHVEPDHCATMMDLMLRFPDVKVVTTQKAAGMIMHFFDNDISANLQIVKEGDTLCTGRHTLRFVLAPMVHWPEVMMTYDTADQILFSADAFGTFGALNGNLFADQESFDRDWLDDARRYYTNIVGKYGQQVQMVLKKAASIPIKMLLPLHGPLWRQDFGYIIGKYDLWSRYEAEEKGVLIVYGSIYGHTAAVAERLASLLSDRGVSKQAVYDVSNTHASQLVSEAFRYSHIVFASATYNNGIFTPMEDLLNDLKCHNMQNRHVALIENGSWAPVSGKLMRASIETWKGVEFVGDTISFKSAAKQEHQQALESLADAIVASLNA